MHKAALAPVAWQSSDSSLALSKLECSAKKYIETEILKYKKHNIAQHGLPGNSAKFGDFMLSIHPKVAAFLVR